MDTLIVFDMDGVLAEVTESYREAIVQTVERFTTQRVGHDLIQKYKNAGGWNNDWALSQKISIPGLTQLASSSVPAMIIVTFGMTSASSISVDPHSGQKRR